MRNILDIVPDIAASNSTVLIQGPTGTGKELVARAIHNLSPRAKHKFVAVNCGALPDTLLESELFGYRKGAFTGADRDKPGRFALKVRIPGWARNEPVPSDLYRVAPGSKDKWEFAAKINGQDAKVALDKGYAVLTRDWMPGDTITVDWPMPIQRILCNEKVEANRGRVALQRGPVVYCIEHPDIPDGKVANLVLANDAQLTTERRDNLLGGVTVIAGTAQSARWQPDGDGRKVITEPVEFTAIPYYAWAHRGRGEMAVWLPRTWDVADPLPIFERPFSSN